VLLLGTAVEALLTAGQVGARGSGPGVARHADAGAQGLVSRLSVLRRSQTSADLLPSPLHWVLRAPENGPIIPALTRLVATPPGA